MVSGDVVMVVMTSNATSCITGSPATSNAIATTVTPITSILVGNPSSTPTLCINTALTNITHATTGATGIASPSSAPNYIPRGVVYPTQDEDLGNVTISLNGSIVLNNSTPVNSLSGTIGTASGIAGGYSHFTAFGPYNIYAGSTYSFSLSSITVVDSYENQMAIYIDYNRNGLFTDAGEKVYGTSSTFLGPHTETGTFTVPASASNGLTRMRVICNEGLINSPTQRIEFGEVEEYTLNIGMPVGVNASWANNTLTISGTPTAPGTFNYSIPLEGGCSSVNATGSFTVISDNTAGNASSTPTLCVNTTLTNLTHITTSATGIGSATGLPDGVSASWANNMITISGTPTASGIFNYSIPLTGGCGNVSATGTITVNGSTSTTNIIVCSSQIPYLWNGGSYTSSGVYTNTVNSTLGCDSIATLNLTIKQANSSIETISSPGAYTWHGNTYTSSTNEPTWTGVNAAGCDSVVTLHLTITCTPTES
jgi:hypothetical protein